MKKQLEDRIEKLKKDHEQFMANLNFITGAIKECELMLSQLPTEPTSDIIDVKTDTPV